MWRCGCVSCLFGQKCSISEKLDDEELCDDWIDINNFYSEEISEGWREFSYNRYTEGCLDTELDEYTLFDW